MEEDRSIDIIRMQILMDQNNKIEELKREIENQNNILKKIYILLEEDKICVSTLKNIIKEVLINKKVIHNQSKGQY
jgi:hypothetical protein